MWLSNSRFAMNRPWPVLVCGALAAVAALAQQPQPAKPVNNLPDSRCLQLKDKSFYCLGAADRYAIETTAANLLVAQQQVAAQYAMLLSS